MKKLLLGLAAVPFLAGIAMAGQPISLNDVQMDKVTAGDIIIPNAGDFGQAVIVPAYKIIPQGSYFDAVVNGIRIRVPPADLRVPTGFTIVGPP